MTSFHCCWECHLALNNRGMCLPGALWRMSWFKASKTLGEHQQCQHNLACSNFFHWLNVFLQQWQPSHALLCNLGVTQRWVVFNAAIVIQSFCRLTQIQHHDCCVSAWWITRAQEQHKLASQWEHLAQKNFAKPCSFEVWLPKVRNLSQHCVCSDWQHCEDQQKEIVPQLFKKQWP